MFKMVIVVATLVGCTKHNPAVCCNTPTQCASFGLDGVIGCDTGKVCDATGTCISPQCASSAECSDPTAYCSSAGLCEMSCVADTECPGGGQAADQIHCVGGACVECGGGADCPASAPICAQAMCRACATDSECPSEACASDGTCVDDASIAYVDPTGPDAADCSQATPCSLSHGLSIGRTYTVLAAGTYTDSQTLTIIGTRWVIGTGQKPLITRSAVGPIITVGTSSSLHFSNIEVTGATNTTSTSGDGVGIECVGGGSILSMSDVIVTQNQADGVHSTACSIDASQSQFINNGSIGIEIQDNSMTVDRCLFSSNSYGMTFDGGTLKATNSFFVRNANDGADISTQFNTVDFEFNTVVDNAKYGLVANSFDSLPNNIVARSGMLETNCNGCQLPGSVVLHSVDVSTLHFLSPDAQPFDYHVGAGSIAIDAAVAATLDHDYDGDVRPKGANRDLGADEAQ